MTRDCQTPNPTTDTDSRRRSRSSDENTPALTAATGFVPAQPSAGPTADGERTMALTNAWAPAISTSWRPPKYLARAWPRPMCSISPNPCLRSKASISSRVNKVTKGSPNPALGPGPRRIHRRRIHRQDRPPDPVRRLHHPAGLLRPQETPRKGASPTSPAGPAATTSPDAARTIAALLALRGHVIAPILAGIGSPRIGREPKTWTTVDRGYEDLGIGLQTLFLHVGIAPRPASARQQCVDQRNAPS